MLAKIETGEKLQIESYPAGPFSWQSLIEIDNDFDACPDRLGPDGVMESQVGIVDRVESPPILT